MAHASAPVAKHGVVLREEFDDWAVLFDPDTGDAVGLNPVGVAIWKLIDGRRDLRQIGEALRGEFDQVPAEIEAHLTAFCLDLCRRGFLSLPEEPVAP